MRDIKTSNDEDIGSTLGRRYKYFFNVPSTVWKSTVLCRATSKNTISFLPVIAMTISAQGGAQIIVMVS